jgi:Holliday junction resolvase-like predicted endonuclease
LVGAVDHFIAERQLDLEVRFDIIAFTVKGSQWELKHIKQAFYPWQ